jgi:hypothetical protein
MVKSICIKIFVVSLYLIHLLVGRLYGIFALSIIMYYSATSIGLSQPFTAHDLISWLYELPEGYKTTVFTSLLTIVGFLIAFSIGSTQQKQQFLTQMKLEVASDIEEFFNEASRKSTDAKIYAEYLLKIAGIIEKREDQNSIDYHLYNVVNETHKFLQAREILKSKSVEVHRFQGKYSLVLASTWGVTKQLDMAINAFIEITERMWFPTPLFFQETPNKETVFMNHIDKAKCQNFIDIYEKNYSIMNSTTGGLRGRLLSPITGMNFSFIMALLKSK